MLVAVRTRAAVSPSPTTSGSSVRGDVVVLALSIVAVSAIIVHNHAVPVSGEFSDFSDLLPLVLFIGLPLLGFAGRLRSAATWTLMICAWVFVVMSLVGLVPQAQWSTTPTSYRLQVGAHALMLLAQIPLIVMLVRRLNGSPACRWTAPR